jgi:hypothetical protein
MDPLIKRQLLYQLYAHPLGNAGPSPVIGIDHIVSAQAAAIATLLPCPRGNLSGARSHVAFASASAGGILWN